MWAVLRCIRAVSSAVALYPRVYIMAKTVAMVREEAAAAAAAKGKRKKREKFKVYSEQDFEAEVAKRLAASTRKPSKSHPAAAAAAAAAAAPRKRKASPCTTDDENASDGSHDRRDKKKIRPGMKAPNRHHFSIVSSFCSKYGYYPHGAELLRLEQLLFRRGLSVEEATARATAGPRTLRSNVSRDVKAKLITLFQHSGRKGGAGDDALTFRVDLDAVNQAIAMVSPVFEQVLRHAFGSRRGRYSVHDVAVVATLVHAHLRNINMLNWGDLQAVYHQYLAGAVRNVGLITTEDKVTYVIAGIDDDDEVRFVWGVFGFAAFAG